MDREGVFAAIERSKITFTDMGILTGIRRETFHRWKSGSPIGDLFRFKVVCEWCRRITLACDAGDLPLEVRMKSKERLRTLRRIIAAHAR
jgi:hypothetical protein